MRAAFFVLFGPSVLLALLVPVVSGGIALVSGATFSSVLPTAIPFVLILNHLIVLFGLFLLLRREQTSMAEIGWRSPRAGVALAREVAIGLFASIVLIALVDYVVRPSLGLAEAASNANAQLTQSSATRWAWFISFLVLPPIEETVFRGYGISRLRGRFGVIPAVLITSFFFGVLHLNAGLREALSAGILGLLCAAIFLVRRDLVAVSVAHSARNIVTAIGLL